MVSKKPMSDAHVVPMPMRAQALGLFDERMKTPNGTDVMSHDQSNGGRSREGTRMQTAVSIARKRTILRTRMARTETMMFGPTSVLIER